MLFDNATIITVDGERRIYKHGALVFEDDRISAIGTYQLISCTKNKKLSMLNNG